MVRNVSIKCAPKVNTGSFLTDGIYEVLFSDIKDESFLIGNPASGEFLNLDWTDANCKGIDSQASNELRIFCSPKTNQGEFLATNEYEILQIDLEKKSLLIGHSGGGFLEIDYRNVTCKGIAKVRKNL